jgi:hypothetical protein
MLSSNSTIAIISTTQSLLDEPRSFGMNANFAACRKCHSCIMGQKSTSEEEADLFALGVNDLLNYASMHMRSAKSERWHSWMNLLIATTNSAMCALSLDQVLSPSLSSSS